MSRTNIGLNRIGCGGAIGCWRIIAITPLHPGELGRPLAVLFDPLLKATFQCDLATPGNGIIQKTDVSNFIELLSYLLELLAAFFDDAPRRAFRQTLEIKITGQGQLDLLISSRRISSQTGKTR